MDFFQAQEAAKRRTTLLVGLFALAVASIVLGVYLVLVLGGAMSMGVGVGFDPVLFGVVAVGTLALIAGGSATRTAQLRKGGSAVAGLMGAREVDPATRDPAERRLVNVVEEMSVASGVPVPGIYVMDDEPSINAFAAGYTIHDAAVAVTRGTLEKLNREELQGVIAHEFSHILNGDMRLNIRLIGLLFGILLLAVVGRGILRGQMVRRRQRGSKGVLLGMALIALGYLGVFFGKLIKAAVSRQREFLADAAAVQFTRNPRGIGGALQKIADDAHGSRIQDHHAEELSHLFFANGVGGALARSMATHPPIEERIRRIDPALAGEPAARGSGEGTGARTLAQEGAQSLAPAAGEATGQAGISALTAAAAAGLASGAAGHGRTGASAKGPGEGAQALLSSVGNPSADHLGFAGRLLAEIPDRVRDAAHDRTGAQAVILALLGGDDEASRAARLQAARALDGFPGHGDSSPQPDGAHASPGRGSGVEAQLEEVGPLVDQIAPVARLPLVDLCLSALHQISPEEARALRSAVDRVIQADGEMRPFDFALVHILWRHLPTGQARGGARRTSGRSLAQVRRELELVLSALAWSGGRDRDAAATAFDAGARAVARKISDLSLLPEEAVGLVELDQALERLERTSLDVRRRTLEACAQVILADESVQVEEVELLRAVAESLEIPLPPLIATS